MSALSSGLLFNALSVLACGYVIYDAPICRLWWPKLAGYVLYFRIVVAGLSLALPLAVLLYLTPLQSINVFNVFTLKLDPSYAPILAFFIAIVARTLAKLFVWCYGAKNTEWRHQLELENLEKGLAQIVYQKMGKGEMIMVTLENNKVYGGWPVDVPNSEYNKWLHLVPQWSGYRDPESTIHVQINYVKVYGDTPPLERDPMLISVERIVTVQPFDAEIFQKFNPPT